MMYYGYRQTVKFGDTADGHEAPTGAARRRGALLADCWDIRLIILCCHTHIASLAKVQNFPAACCCCLIQAPGNRH